MSTATVVESSVTQSTVVTISSKSRNVISEILDTEESFCKDMSSVLEGYKKFFDEFAEDHVFILLSTSIASLVNFSSDLQQRLAPSRDDVKAVCEIFHSRRAEFDEYYGNYCDLYPITCAILENIDKTSHVFLLIEQCKNEIHHMLPFSSYLLKPVQRVLKYHLLLATLNSDKLLSDVERESVQTSADAMKNVADTINERKRIQEGYAQLPILRSKISNLEKPLPFMVVGPVVLQDNFKVSGKKRYVVLFEHVMLIMKVLDNGDYHVSHGLAIDTIILMEKNTKDDTSFELREQRKEKRNFILSPKNLQVKEQWIMHIKRLILQHLNVNLDNSKLTALFGQNVGNKIQTINAVQNLVHLDKLISPQRANSTEISRRSSSPALSEKGPTTPDHNEKWRTQHPYTVGGVGGVGGGGGIEATEQRRARGRMFNLEKLMRRSEGATKDYNTCEGDMKAATVREGRSSTNKRSSLAKQHAGKKTSTTVSDSPKGIPEEEGHERRQTPLVAGLRTLSRDDATSEDQGLTDGDEGSSVKSALPKYGEKSREKEDAFAATVAIIELINNERRASADRTTLEGPSDNCEAGETEFLPWNKGFIEEAANAITKAINNEEDPFSSTVGSGAKGSYPRPETPRTSTSDLIPAQRKSLNKVVPLNRQSALKRDSRPQPIFEASGTTPLSMVPEGGEPIIGVIGGGATSVSRSVSSSVSSCSSMDVRTTSTNTTTAAATTLANAVAAAFAPSNTCIRLTGSSKTEDVPTNIVKSLRSIIDKHVSSGQLPSSSDDAARSKAVPISKVSRIGSILLQLQQQYVADASRFKRQPEAIRIGRSGITLDQLPDSPRDDKPPTAAAAATTTTTASTASRTISEK